MRIILSLVILVFIVGCDSSTSQILGQKRNYYKRIGKDHMDKSFTLIDQTVLYTSESSTCSLEILKRFPHYYIVMNKDTVLNRSWSESSFNALRWPDTSLFVTQPVQIYEKGNLLPVISLEGNVLKKTQWLINCGDSGFSFLAIGKVHCLQLDADSSIERIVQIPNPWYHFYLVFDSTKTGWKFVGQISLPDKGNYAEIDLSLTGYFGLRAASSGTGLYAADYLYYKINADSIVHCFTINKTVGSTWFHFHQDYSCYISSVSSCRVINDRRIWVSHEISMVLFSFEDSDKEIPFHKEIVQYELISDDFFVFRSSKSLPGFDSAYAGGQCQFYPESYMYHRLSRLKNTGTKKQKTYLKDFVYDSSAYFR